jgi:hypothetical protein
LAAGLSFVSRQKKALRQHSPDCSENPFLFFFTTEKIATESGKKLQKN